MFVYALVGITMSVAFIGVEAMIKGFFTIHTLEIYGYLALVCLLDYVKVTA